MLQFRLVLSVKLIQFRWNQTQILNFHCSEIIITLWIWRQAKYIFQLVRNFTCMVLETNSIFDQKPNPFFFTIIFRGPFISMSKSKHGYPDALCIRMHLKIILSNGAHPKIQN